MTDSMKCSINPFQLLSFLFERTFAGTPFTYNSRLCCFVFGQSVNCFCYVFQYPCLHLVILLLHSSCINTQRVKTWFLFSILWQVIFYFLFPFQFKGSTPSECWNKIYKRIKKIQTSSSDCSSAEAGGERIYKSGSYMFGFSNPEVLKLIQVHHQITLPLNFHITYLHFPISPF